jgi:diaminobutyrate-2-oxoglutarate transaminase
MTEFASYDRLESSVRSYSRRTPVMFSRASGHRLFSKDGIEYADFLSGSGALNYGHNDPDMKAALIEYVSGDGLAMGLDFYFEAKEAFLEAFDELILRPRDQQYKLQFVGPTGTNAVEAALKLARKFTGRANVVSFTNGYHGCTLGALSATGNTSYRSGSQWQLGQVYRVPFDGYMEGLDTAELLGRLMSDPSSGVDNVAAIILECIQGEGGFNAATPQWLKKVEAIARSHEAILIVDEVQSGCGRSGSFFSFEYAGIRPDIITMAKSLSGFGLPLAMVLIRPDLDVWEPAEHTGTFRGNASAFVTGTVALRKFWADGRLTEQTLRYEEEIAQRLIAVTERHDCRRKGRGMMQGLQFSDRQTAARVQSLCLERKLLVESCGPSGEVIKLLPPLTISERSLDQGLSVLVDAIGYLDRGNARRQLIHANA